MLLLLRGAPPANPGVTFSLSSQLVFDNSAHVTFSTLTGFGPFDSVELQVSVNLDLITGFAGAGHATVGPGVVFATSTAVALSGGFSERVSFANLLGSGWTVGTTLQGAVSFGTLLGFSGELSAIPAVRFGLLSDFAPGAGNLSGGTITAGVGFALQNSFAGSPVMVDRVIFALET